MSSLLRDTWLGSLLAFLLGAGITWYLLDRRLAPSESTPLPHHRTPAPAAPTQAPATEARATAAPTAPTESAPADTTPPQATPTEATAPADSAPADSAAADSAAVDDAADDGAASEDVRVGFSRLMGGEPTLFDEVGETPAESVDVPPGKYGEGSADAVPHQGPPDGFTIKGNEQSKLFHTPDSPYYGRTKPEVWFRTEADAERAGFTKYVRRPRKSD